MSNTDPGGPLPFPPGRPDAEDMRMAAALDRAGKHPSPAEMAREAHPDSHRAGDTRGNYAAGVTAERARWAKLLRERTGDLLRSAALQENAEERSRTLGAAEELLRLAKEVA